MTSDEFMALSRGNKGGDQRKFAYFFSSLDALPASVQADVGDRCVLPPPPRANASFFVFIVVLRSFWRVAQVVSYGGVAAGVGNERVGGRPAHPHAHPLRPAPQLLRPNPRFACVCGGACACAIANSSVLCVVWRRAQEVPVVLARAVAVPLPVPPFAPLDPHVAGGPGRTGAVRRQRLLRVPR
jgi:hypothetical protein